MNLVRFKDFLSQLGNPQQGLQIIHVAGSDGKGSTCAMLTAVLQQLGYKVGLYTSPHLHSVRERIQINREWINKDAFVHWTNHLRNTMDEFSPGQSGFTTFFELITAMGFLYFQQEKVDFAVIETGLGGRLDATNVAEPKLCVITHISMEHADKLGETIEKIADEKLGILRKQSPVVIGHQDSSLLPHFHARLTDHPSKTVFVDEQYEVLSNWIENNKRYIQCQYDKEKVKLISPLLGHYQTQNVITAHAAMCVLADQNQIQHYSDDAFNQGLQHTKWDGRFEVIPYGNTKVVLDIAHTVKGVASLKRSLEEVFPHAKRHYVMGFLRDKNVSGMIDALCDENDRFIFTAPPTPRALPLGELQKRISGMNLLSPVQFEEDALTAFDLALQHSNKDDVVIVAGSLYLVSAVREKLIQKLDD